MTGGVVLWVAACAGEAPLDVEALEARDVLGVAPEVANAWTEGERARALDILRAASVIPDGTEIATPTSAPLGETLGPVLDSYDAERARRGQDAVVLSRAEEGADSVYLYSYALEAEEPTPSDAPVVIAPIGWEEADVPDWDRLVERCPQAIANLARTAGFSGQRLHLAPAPQRAFGMVYLAENETIWVNPVLLTALPDEPPAARSGVRIEWGGGSAERRAAEGASGGDQAVSPVASSDSPYSFYGSLGECAAALRHHCENCTQSCNTRTSDAQDFTQECEALSADNGIGYHLLCANLAASIDTVADCIVDRASECTINRQAGALIAALDANQDLLASETCRDAADRCLADLYGAPDEDFPGPPDPQAPDPPPLPPEPRRVDVNCGEGDANCDFGPELSCSADSCAEGSSCGGCDTGCDDDGSGGGGGGGGGGGSSCDPSCDPSCDSAGCDADCGDCGGSDSSGSGGGGGCGGSDSTDSGGGCGGSDSSGDGCGGCGGDSGGCGDCGGSSGGGDSGDCGDCGSGGSSECNVTAQRRSSGMTMALFWGLLPLAFFQLLSRRERRNAARRSS